MFAWKFLKAPRQHRRRQRQAPEQFHALSDASSHPSTMVQGLEAFSSSGGSRAHDVVDDFFQAASVFSFVIHSEIQKAQVNFSF